MCNCDIIYLVFEKETYKVRIILNSEDECIEAFNELENDKLDWCAINLNAVLQILRCNNE